MTDRGDVTSDDGYNAKKSLGGSIRAMSNKIKDPAPKSPVKVSSPVKPESPRKSSPSKKKPKI
jgi:hypothetical protein